MSIERKYCNNHPERLAIGICVETKKPICGECSTRYNGVNYSKEGLIILQARRRTAESGDNRDLGWHKVVVAAVFLSPILYFLYFFACEWAMNWLDSP